MNGGFRVLSIRHQTSGLWALLPTVRFAAYGRRLLSNADIRGAIIDFASLLFSRTKENPSERPCAAMMAMPLTQ